MSFSAAEYLALVEAEKLAYPSVSGQKLTAPGFGGGHAPAVQLPVVGDKPKGPIPQLTKTPIPGTRPPTGVHPAIKSANDKISSALGRLGYGVLGAGLGAGFGALEHGMGSTAPALSDIGHGAESGAEIGILAPFAFNPRSDDSKFKRLARGAAGTIAGADIGTDIGGLIGGGAGPHAWEVGMRGAGIGAGAGLGAAVGQMSEVPRRPRVPDEGKTSVASALRTLAGGLLGAGLGGAVGHAVGGELTPGAPHPIADAVQHSPFGEHGLLPLTHAPQSAMPDITGTDSDVLGQQLQEGSAQQGLANAAEAQQAHDMNQAAESGATAARGSLLAHNQQMGAGVGAGAGAAAGGLASLLHRKPQPVQPKVARSLLKGLIKEEERVKRETGHYSNGDPEGGKNHDAFVAAYKADRYHEKDDMENEQLKRLHETEMSKRSSFSALEYFATR